MKKLIALFALLLVTGWSRAEDAPATSAPASPGNTTVTSEQFSLDMGKVPKQGFFTGNVLVAGTDFKMTADEMTVFFAEKDNKVEHLIARGNVQIEQPDRTAKANQAEYTVADDKIVLTGSPEVVQNKNRVSGTKITIYRSSNRMETDGRSRVVLYEDLGAKKSD